MPTFTANRIHETNGSCAQARRVVFVVFPDITLLDVTGPLQAFNDAGYGLSDPGYEIVVASQAGGRTATNTTVSLDTERLSDIDPTTIHTLLVAGGQGVHAAITDVNFVKTITDYAPVVGRLGSVCSGAFVLAAAGLLDGRRAATHWSRCDQLQVEYPAVRVERDPIYICDGGVWTSAGITAGIDLALAMIAEDLGRAAAMDVARELVAYMVRPGGQSQFSTILSGQTNEATGRFARLHDWVSANLTSDLRIEALAGHMNMSPRTFARSYAAEEGCTPAKMVEARRLRAACDSLENTRQSVSEISAACGFGQDERMRRAFIRTLGVAPSDYRARFSV